MRPIATVGQLRPRRDVEAELDWFFNRAECDMGVQSNYLAMLGLHGPGSNVPSPEDAVLAAHRFRHILRWLKAIDTADAGVLQCAYELRAWPIPLWDRLGRLTGIVVRIACAMAPLPGARDALQAIEMARADLLAVRCARAGIDAELHAMRREAEARFAHAHQAYSAVRGEGGSS
jgi:hypothetical protein